MKTRIIAGVGIVGVLLAVLFLAPGWVAAVFVGLTAALGSYELLWGTGLVKHIRLNIYSGCFAFAVAGISTILTSSANKISAIP